MPKILIADDTEVIRTQLKIILSQPAGWIVCGEATNGQQAVLMASQLKPDLIVLDFLMPMLNGLQAAEEILKSTPAVPIVLYTLHKVLQLDLEAKRIGVRKAISKSDGSDALIACVEELLGHGPPWALSALLSVPLRSLQPTT